MASTVSIDLRHVARGLTLSLHQVQAVVELLDEGNTVPFITRYRKDRTGDADEEQVRQVQQRLLKTRLLADRKQTILRSIESQGKLSESLTKQILAAGTTKRLEDLYLPYKPRKQTLATLARTRGLEELAQEILQAAPSCANLDARSADFANPDRQVPSAADALLGAGHILAEQFSERAELRQRLREILQRTGKIVSARAEPESKTPADKARPEKPAGRAIRPTGDMAGDANVAHAEGTSPGITADMSASSQTPPTAELAIEPLVASQPVDDRLGLADEVGALSIVAAEQATHDLLQADTESTTDIPDDLPPIEEDGLAAWDDASEGASLADVVQVSTGSDAPISAGDVFESKTEMAAESTAALPGVGVQEHTAVVPRSKVSPPRSAAASSRGAQQIKLSKKELKKKKTEERRIAAFRDYFGYTEELKKIPPHRILAINRGERAKVLRVKIENDLEAMNKVLDELLVPPEHPHADYLRGCARDSLVRLILPALERELRREMTDRAEAHAVEVFARNLRNLLLQPPVRDRRVLAADPGYKSGCKLVALDQFGTVLEHGTIFLVGGPDRLKQAQQKVVDLVQRHELSVVAIGNGTACRATEDFFSALLSGELKDKGVAYVIVNEAGASVYSTSRIGREELPSCDASVRGAASIGRRLQDPLSELVKIDAANIGVGLYQHDVKAKHLRVSLDEVVESCVNYVGVDVNTASPALLRYVSGLNQLTARRIYEHRLQNGPLRSREQLRDIPGIGEATFVQAAGFLKITEGENPLDATWIHPESYAVANRVLSSLECTPADLTNKEGAPALAKRIAGVHLEEMAKQLEVGTLTLKDILAQLARPGRDPREDLPKPVFKQGILKLEDLAKGMELTGTVLNVVDFGCFIDIGMHDSGLVHVSHLANKYVRDPHEIVAVGDIVKVWVLDVDKDRRRVSLTMVAPGSERPHPPRRAAKPQEPHCTEAPSDGPRGQARAPAQPGRPPRPAGSAPPSGPPRPKGPPKPRDQRRPPPPKPTYRPRVAPKPVIPITDDMKAGKEPMRTFADLAQFFQHQKQSTGPARKQERPAPAQILEAPAQQPDQPPQPDNGAPQPAQEGSHTQEPIAQVPVETPGETPVAQADPPAPDEPPHEPQ